jgi:Sec-independent protein translocase protein TatA
MRSGVLDPGVLGISWGEIALIGVLVALLVATGRVATFVRGVRRGMRDDAEGIRVRFVERKEVGKREGRDDATKGQG